MKLLAADIKKNKILQCMPGHILDHSMIGVLLCFTDIILKYVYNLSIKVNFT